jgi:hypothetical protein
MDAGAVYAFQRTGTTWSQTDYIKPLTPDVYDEFGASVALSGNTLVVGAPKEDCDATGVNGDSTNNNGGASGAAYVFRQVGTT